MPKKTKKKLIRNISTIIVLLIAGISYGTSQHPFQTPNKQNHPQNISSSNQNHAPTLNATEKQLVKIPFSYKKYPEYYAKADNNANLSSQELKQTNQNGGNFWVNYSPLDQYGRAGEAIGLVTYKSIYDNASRNKPRPSFPASTRPAGLYSNAKYLPSEQRWEGGKSNNTILQLDDYHGYLYNKSHSFAYSLGGDMQNHNVTVGTRGQNVGSNSTKDPGGMSYPETSVRNAIYKNHNLKVLYKAKPIYNGNELLPRGTHVQAYSVNDKGKAINLNIWVFNAQNGVNINYKTGQWQK